MTAENPTAQRLKKVFFDFLEKSGLTSLETRLAAFLGRFYKRYVLRNRPLRGRVGRIYMTRAKIRNRSENLIFQGHISATILMEQNPKIYEVVYHGTIIECAPRTVTKLNCPKEEGREELNFDCFSQVIPKVEHAVWRDSADYVSMSRSGKE